MFWFPNIIEISKTEKYLLNSTKNNYNNIFLENQFPQNGYYDLKKLKTKVKQFKSPNPSWSSSPSSSSLHHIFYIAAMPSSSPVTVLYCSQWDGRVSLYDPVIGNNTRYVIVIVYNSTVNTYYQSPKPELVLLPSPSSLPSVMFFTLLL